MTVHFHTCDHCGKQLDEMHDWPETSVEVCYNLIDCDLCADCVEELTALVSKFVKDGDKDG